MGVFRELRIARFNRNFWKKEWERSKCAADYTFFQNADVIYKNLLKRAA